MVFTSLPIQSAAAEMGVSAIKNTHNLCKTVGESAGKAAFENILTIEMPSTGENTVVLLSAVLAMSLLVLLCCVRRKTNINI